MRKALLTLLTAAAALAQYPTPGSAGGGGGGGGCTAGTGITCVGSTISVDTAVIQSRATAQAGTSTYCRSTDLTDAYTCALPVSATAYTTGMCVTLNPDTANTLGATLNIDALGAKSILGPFGSALADGDIPAAPVQVCYNGTAFIKQGFSSNVTTLVALGGAAGAKTLQVRGNTSNDASIQEWQNNSGSTLASVTAVGHAYFPVINLDGWWTLSQTSAGGISFGSGHCVAWGSSSTNSSSGTVSGDTGLCRNAAGVVEVNNGTLGTYRDLKVRDITSTGQISITGTVAGTVEFGQGTIPSVGTTSVKLYADTAVTAYKMRLPAAASTGVLYGTNTAGDVVQSFVDRLPAAAVPTRSYGVAVGDPAGSALATGVLGYVVAPAACTISGWDVVVDSGTATVDVWKVSTGTAKPTVANTITASAKPAISTGTAIASTTLTGWTTSVAAGDIFGFNLDATSGPKYITVDVRCQ